MALIYCPECGHEISQSAVACPQCGRPINPTPAPAPMNRVIVREEPVESSGFPPWLIPVALLGLGALVLLFYLMSREAEPTTSNMNVNITARGSSTPRSEDRPASQTTIPPAETTVPSTGTSSLPPMPPSSQTVPGTQTTVEPTTGKVALEAKIASPTGAPQAARNAKFYLLDQDVESILSSANVEPIEGQTLSGSMGLAAADPGKYGDFTRKAMAALQKHIKYSGTTDGSGKASLSNVKPDSYYLFGVTRTGKGFAMWNSNVSINAGDNNLTLPAAPITDLR